MKYLESGITITNEMETLIFTGFHRSSRSEPSYGVWSKLDRTLPVPILRMGPGNEATGNP